MEYAHFALRITGVVNPKSMLRAPRASIRKSFIDEMYGINVMDR
jgi:hypothetical protein